MDVLVKRKSYTVLLLTFTLCSVSPTLVQAWHFQQHRIICEAAWQELSPDTKDMVLGLHKLANEHKYYRKFSDSCAWADDARNTSHPETDQLHYVNVTLGADNFNYDRDCVMNDCVVAAINHYTSVLEMSAVSKGDIRRQANALRFLAHFVADIHQPLHIGYRDDRGGNAINLIWLNGEKKNLHTVWDSLISQQAGLNSYADADNLLTGVSHDVRDRWSQASISQWANGSYQITRQYVYQSRGIARLKNGDTITQDYVDGAKPLVRIQIQKAAVRLSYILNRIAKNRHDED